MTKQKDATPATTNPRYSYRTPKKEKEKVDNRIKALVSATNLENDEKYYKLTQNDLFLEAVYLGLEALEKSKISPKKEHHYLVFEERK